MGAAAELVRVEARPAWVEGLDAAREAEGCWSCRGGPLGAVGSGAREGSHAAGRVGSVSEVVSAVCGVCGEPMSNSKAC